MGYLEAGNRRWILIGSVQIRGYVWKQIISVEGNIVNIQTKPLTSLVIHRTRVAIARMGREPQF